jgi:hypothetical protein
MSRTFLLPEAVIALAFLQCSCSTAGSSMAPVGEGLRFLGVSLVVAVLVAVLGVARKGGGRHG